MAKLSKYAKAAKDLNKVLGLDPPIDVDVEEDELKDDLEETATDVGLKIDEKLKEETWILLADEFGIEAALERKESKEEGKGKPKVKDENKTPTPKSKKPTPKAKTGKDEAEEPGELFEDVSKDAMAFMIIMIQQDPDITDKELFAAMKNNKKKILKKVMTAKADIIRLTIALFNEMELLT